MCGVFAHMYKHIYRGAHVEVRGQFMKASSLCHVGSGIIFRLSGWWQTSYLLSHLASSKLFLIIQEISPK